MRGAARAPRTILAVEDDPVIRKAIERALDGQAEVLFAATGRAALQALAASPQPAFLLLDYMLPDMDGLEVLTQVRAEPRTRTLPVIMFSSLADAARIRAALAAGANSWVRKTDDPKALAAAVQGICGYWLDLHTRA